MNPNFAYPVMLAILALFWTGMFAAALYVSYLGKPTVHTLLEHQRGLQFRRGKVVRELGAGSYRLRLGIDYVVWADIRPQPLQFDRMPVHTADGIHASITVSGSMRVNDVRTAVFRSRHHNHAATGAAFVAIREFMSGADRAQLSGDREKLSAELFQQAKKAAAEFGVELTSLRISELNFSGAQDRAVGFAPN